MASEEIRNGHICTTNLLSDEPSDEDALGGGHQRTARALLDIVLNTRGGKSVALLGGWGSGKSTVVRLFQKAVNRKLDIRVFVFDAWCHEGDPLRRSFLERLAEFLEKVGWLGGQGREEIKDMMDELAGLKEEAHSQTSSIVTPAGKWIGLFLALGVPLGTALLSSHPIHEEPHWVPLVGFATLISPLAPALFFTYHTWKKTKRIEFPSLFSQNIHTTRTSTIRTPEPTSVEFEARFRYILERVLTEERRLVIVVDNLDRLPLEQARSVWAAMRTFFEVQTAPWADRFWLVVPFDPSAIPQLWGESEAGNNKGDLIEVFLSKMFQVRLQVPPPVLSDWKAYLLRLLRKAFPGHDEEDFHLIYRVYRAFEFPDDRPPAPRELKQFVNLIGSQHRIWQDAIPLPMQALYVALNESLAENPREILANRDADVIKLFPEEVKWKEYLLAQHFNIEPDRALQVLFQEEIRKALENPRSDLLGDIGQQLRPEAVGTLVLEVLANAAEWVEDSPELLAKAALAIEEAGNLLSEADQKLALHLLRGRINTVERWQASDDETIDGLLTLITSIPDDQKRRNTLETIMSRIQVPDIKVGAKLLAKFLDKIQRKLGIDISEDIRFPIQEPADWIVALGSLDFRKTTESIRSFFKPTDPAAVFVELRARAGSGNFGINEALAIPALRYIGAGEENDWAELVDTLQGKLETTNLHPEEMVRALIYALVQAVPIYANAQKALKRLATHGFIMHHLGYVTEKESISTLVLPLLIYNPSGRIRSPAGQANQGVQKYADLLQNPGKVNFAVMAVLFAEVATSEDTDFSLENLLDSTAQNSQTKGIVGSLLQVLDNIHPGEFLSPDILLKQGQALSEILGEDGLEGLVQKHHNEMAETAQRAGFNIEYIPNYRRILKTFDNGISESFLLFLRDGFRSLNTADWLTLLSRESHEDSLFILNMLTRSSFHAELDHRLADALQETAPVLLTSQEAYSTEAIVAYRGFLSEDTRRNFAVRIARNLPKLLTEHSDREAAAFLAAFGDICLEANAEMPTEDLKDLLLIWLPEALERLAPAELGWFAELLTECRARLPDLDEAILNEALERVDNVRTSSEDENILTILNRIATLLRRERVESIGN